MTRIALISALALLLSSCISFGAKPPPQLLTLTSSATMQDGATVSTDKERTFVIMVPEAPRTVDNTRVPVYMGDSAVAYVKDATWSDKPTRLLRDVISDTLSTNNSVIVLNAVHVGAEEYTNLSGVLHRFGYNESTGEVEIVYDAVLRIPDRSTIKRRFTASQPASPVDAVTVGAALNQASNRLAKDVSDWLVQQQ